MDQNDRRYSGEIERLRSKQRLTLLEVPRVIQYSLDQIVVKSVLDIGTGSGIFAEALRWTHALSSEQYKAFQWAARETAEAFSESTCATESLNLYELVCHAKKLAKPARESILTSLLRRLECEWDLLLKKIGAVADTVL